NQLSGTLTTNQPLRVGKRSTAFPLKGDLADVRIYRRTLTAAEVQAIAAQPVSQIVTTPAARRNASQTNYVARVFREGHAPELQKARQAAAKLRQKRSDYEKKIPTVMVMEDLPNPRDTFVLKRGRYDMPDKGQKVTPGVPGCLVPLPGDAPRNRLGLAR